RALRLLNLRRIRRQPLRSMLAVLAVGAGVSLAVSIVVLTTSIGVSLKNAARALAGPAPLRVIGATSRGGLDEAVLPRVASVPGVAAAIPAVQAVTLAEDARRRSTIVLALGVDCRIEALVGRLGCDPAALTQARD